MWGSSESGGHRARALVLLAGLTASTLAACGAGERQDVQEPMATFEVEVSEPEFPERQRLAEPSTLRLEVRNTGPRTIPNVAVTLRGFEQERERGGSADTSRPVWIVEDEPTGGVTAYADTWALGTLSPGQSETFEWDVTAIQAGTWDLRYRVSAEPDGRAKARLADGRVPEGSLRVSVVDEPTDARVDPDTGEVLENRPPPRDRTPEGERERWGFDAEGGR
ncbi:MAG TPA: hypothetical protein VGV36_04135 [Solirubrobacteraceae bacterium]|nr:hypothetical protein [Solirubrobacteraceae bacterium]